MKRRIIKIDREKCDGCGLCVPACHEGAIEIVDGKATLVKDSYCDGLGDCLGECPQDAITFETREADPYDEEAVQQRLNERAGNAANSVGEKKPAPPKPGGGCPGMRAFSFEEDEDEDDAGSATPAPDGPAAQSELRQWPVQLKLVPVNAPYWDKANLLISADCVPTAYADFHKVLLRGKRLVIACPKLDDTSNYVDKLAAILAENDIKSVTVAIMEVPCCGGLDRMVQQAVAASGKTLPVTTYVAGVQGDLNDKSKTARKGMFMGL